MFDSEEEYTAHCNAEAEAEAQYYTDKAEAEQAQDEYILECARQLVKAINDSGRSVLRPEIADDGFGSLCIYIHYGVELAIEYYGKERYSIVSEISGIK